MATAARPLRLCIRSASRVAAPRTQFRSIPQIAAPVHARALTTTPRCNRPKDDEEPATDETLDVDDVHIEEFDQVRHPEEGDYEGIINAGERFRSLHGAPPMTAAQRKSQLEQLKTMGSAGELVKNLDNNIDKEFPRIRNFIPHVGKESFWHEHETDTDLITTGKNEDPYDANDITSLGHGKFEEYREYREYARLAAWQLPLLSSKHLSG